MRVRLALFAALAVAACVQLPFEGKPCPADGCPSGLACVPNADGDGGTCRAGVDGGAPDAGACVACAENEVCDAGACVRRDCSTVTCGAGQVCANGGCLPQSCGGVTCATGAVCQGGNCVAAGCAFVPCPLGELCADGTCQRRTCADGGVCAGSRVCINGVCQDRSCAGLSCDLDAGLRCEDSQCIACSGAVSETCDNGTDDDCDGLVDCLDPECSGLGCNDNKSCTGGETCLSDGGCGGGMSVSCRGGTDRCLKVDGTCNEATGQCEYPPADAGTGCDDGNGCTVNDVCDGQGSCVSGAPKSCTDPDQCVRASCDPATGFCVHAPRTGESCQDGTACTTNDTCTDAGTCVGVDTNPCRIDAGMDPQCVPYATCEPTTGTCFLTGTRECASNNPCAVAECLIGGVNGPVCLTTGPRVDGYRLDSSQVCCSGSSTQLTSSSSCGGCGMACGATFSCVVVSGCMGPGPSTTGACGCVLSSDCPQAQPCINGQCTPSASVHCVPPATPVMCAGGMACNIP